MSDGKEQNNPMYYIDGNGDCVFTGAYHIARGYCCENGCKHCPYGYGGNRAGRFVHSDDSNALS